MTDKVIKLLSFLTLVTNIAIVLFIALLIHKKFTGKESKYLKSLMPLIKRWGILGAFIISFTSMLGSLFLSEIANFTPCILCWYQRILMYPLTLILGVALWKKMKNVNMCVLPLTLVGIAISGYHYYLQNNPNPLAPCSTVGFSVSCSERYSTNLGYITIPFMALTGFVAISLLVYFASRSTRD